MYSPQTLLSYTSTFCWTFALVPQQLHNYQTKSVEGLSPYLLLLWFMGDVCNLVGCLLTHQLPFQTYLASYFILNDFVLDFQYFYYNYKKRPEQGNIMLIQYDSTVEYIPDDELGADPTENVPQSVTTSTFYQQPMFSFNKGKTLTVITALLSISPTEALPLLKQNVHSLEMAQSSSTDSIGIFFAWVCTAVYCSSRIPQLYHNYLRKSVDGISPLLFTFAVLANTTYALSILFTDELPLNVTYNQFLLNELPYLLGSLGAVFFDGIYFWQREIYKVI